MSQGFLQALHKRSYGNLKNRHLNIDVMLSLL